MTLKLPRVHRLLAMIVFGLLCSGVWSVGAQNLTAQTSTVGVNTNQRSAAIGSPAQKLLTESARRLLNSSPLQAKSRMRVDLFDQQIVAHGSYWQAGQGTGSARWEYAIPAPAAIGSVKSETGATDPAGLFIMQICHRGFFYRLQTGGEEPQLDVTDLRQVSKADSDALFAGQNAWMATGGVSGLLELLANNFDFAEASKVKVGENEVWRMKGDWNENRLRCLLNGQVRHDLIRDEIKWAKLPKQIPHSCEVLLAADDYFPGFPYRVTFFKKFAQDGIAKNKSMVSIEFYELQTNVQLDEEIFNANFDGIRPEDLTDSFVQRIEALQRARRSAQQRRPLSR